MTARTGWTPCWRGRKKNKATAQIMHKADLFSFKFGDICKNVLKPLFNQKMNENHHKSTSIPIPTLQKTTQEQGNIFME